jgi:hypothetical protein
MCGDPVIEETYLIIPKNNNDNKSGTVGGHSMSFRYHHKAGTVEIIVWDFRCLCA